MKRYNINEKGLPFEDNNGVFVYYADVPAVQPVMAGTEDHDEAVRLLGLVFDAWENGDSCTEDGEPDGAYMGQCFQLDAETFDACCNLLNRLNPPRNAALVAPVTERDTQDAKRYRWIRDNSRRQFTTTFSTPNGGDEGDVEHITTWEGPAAMHFDKMIDSAMLAAAPPPEAGEVQA